MPWQCNIVFRYACATRLYDSFVLAPTIALRISNSLARVSGWLCETIKLARKRTEVSDTRETSRISASDSEKSVSYK